MSITGSVGGPVGSIILSGIDASLVPYVAKVLSDWSNGQQPGNLDDALDQLAQRETDHAALTTDPHGASMTVSTKVVAPTIENTSPLLQIDVIDAGTSTLSVDNSGAGVCDLNTSGKITTGTDKGIIAGNGANNIAIDPATGTITPAGTASPLTVADLVLPHMTGYNTVATGECIPQGMYDRGTSASTVVANRMYAIPMPLFQQSLVDAIGVYIGTADATGKLRLGIYEADGTNGEPSTLIEYAGEVVPSTAGAWQFISFASTRTEKPRLTWLVLWTDSSTVTFERSDSSSGITFTILPTSAFSRTQWLYQNSWTGAGLPDPFGTVTRGAALALAPRIRLRKA